MRTTAALLAIPALVLALAACGDDDTSSDSVAPTTVAATTEAPTTSATPSTTAAAATTTAASTPDDGVVEVSLTVGTDSSPDRIVDVPLGASVRLVMVNPSAADEFHLHGYDLEQAAAAGETVTFEFTANQAGDFELESHETEDVYLMLRVA